MCVIGWVHTIGMGFDSMYVKRGRQTYYRICFLHIYRVGFSVTMDKFDGYNPVFVKEQ